MKIEVSKSCKYCDSCVIGEMMIDFPGVSVWGWILLSFFIALSILLCAWRIYVSCKRLTITLTLQSRVGDLLFITL